MRDRLLIAAMAGLVLIGALLGGCEEGACIDAPPTLSNAYRSAPACTLEVVTHGNTEYDLARLAIHVEHAAEVWGQHGITIEHVGESLDRYVPMVLATEPGCDSLHTWDDRLPNDGRVHVIAMRVIDRTGRRYGGLMHGGEIALRTDTGALTLAHEFGHVLGLRHAPGLMVPTGNVESDYLTPEQIEDARERACGVMG